MPVAGWPREMWFGNEKQWTEWQRFRNSAEEKKKERKENKLAENRADNQWRLGRKKILINEWEIGWESNWRRYVQVE